MSEEGLSRRQFLAATGGTAVAATLAGCRNGSGDRESPAGTDDPTDSEASPTTATVDGWPYGYDRPRPEKAAEVMEAAGYGPDNRFELTLTQYENEAWNQMAQLIRDRIGAAHVELSIESAGLSALTERGRNGTLQAYTYGWGADYPSPQNFLQLIYPPNTDYSQPDATGSFAFWTADTPAAERARSAYERVADNPEPTESAQSTRNEAYVSLEEATWAGLPVIPIFHQAIEPMWYDHVDYPVPGAMGGFRQKYNTVSLAEGSRLEMIASGMSGFDPIVGVDSESGAVVSQVFDTLTNYPEGKTATEQLLARGFETSDDYTEYTFELVEGVRFHDGSELTAHDLVYSWRRLAESSNSGRRRFILDVLGVTHETDDDGNVVPGSLGVEAVGNYRFRVTLERPFASVLSLIAYSAFAAVPEGIVGDVEGYGGEMDQSTFATNPVGCGPFAFESWSQGEAAEVTAFGNYHGRSPSVDGVRWQIIDDGTARYNYFMNRNADVAGIPTPQYDPSLLTVERTDDLGRQRGTYGPVRNGETLNWARVPTLTTFYIGFNTREVPLPVRKAMAYVVDQRQFVETVFKDRFVPAYHLTPPLLYPGGASAYWKHAEPGD